jgi:hypothetical protein
MARIEQFKSTSRRSATRQWLGVEAAAYVLGSIEGASGASNQVSIRGLSAPPG